ncbi:MAG: DUF5688 family protein [Parasporobacterium sp.]|nr:DUF5688 family protein [Parasporobacterium sp.]
MKLNDVKNVLKNKGFEVEERTVNKNGNEVKALSIGTGAAIHPTIYARTVEHLENEEELLSYVNKIIQDVPDIDVAILQDRDYIVNHCRSCVRHASDDENIIKWKVYDDLEEYIRIDLDETNTGSMSCIVTKALFETMNVDIEELRMYSRRNLLEMAEIKSMSAVLGEMMGKEFPEIEEPPMLYVGSTKNKIQGAAIILLTDLLDDFCRSHSINAITIIPSSTEEVLFVTEDVDDETINQMIRDVNLQVDEWNILSDHCYHHQLVAA